MKKLLLLLVSIVMIFALTSCNNAKIVSYHIDESGKLIATLEDETTIDLGSLSDTIANGADKIEIDENGYYVINDIKTEIKAKLAESYSIDNDGNLIVTYTDTTTENLGKFGTDAINTIDTISISDDGFYVLNGIKTNISAVDVFEVKFVTGYSATVKTQIVKDGDKVERPQLERAGYTFAGWYCNGEEWRFNSDVVLSEMTLTAEWIANDYNVAFNTGISNTLPNQAITFGSEYSLPTLERTGYTFKGWEYNGNLVTANKWNIADNATLAAKWSANTYTISLDPNGGSVSQSTYTVTYGSNFILPVPTNSFGAFKGWYLNGEKITDNTGASLAPWTYLENKTLTTNWIEEISTLEQFLKIKESMNGHYKLVADIDLNTVEWTPIGSNATPFTGVLDGNGYKIKNLTITGTVSNIAGLFGVSSGIIKNIILEDVNVDINSITEDSKIAALVAYNKGTLENIKALSGTVNIANHSGTLTSYVGGIVSYNEGILKSITNNLNVSGGTYAAGICAYDLSTSSAKAGSYLINNGSVMSTKVAGGIYGYSKQLVFEYMKNTGNITAPYNAGGIIGVNTAQINKPIEVSYCANTGNISSTTNSNSCAGGLTSTAYEIIVTDSYNTGTISGYFLLGEGDIGGLVGKNTGTASYTRCLNTATGCCGFSSYMGHDSVIQDSIIFGESQYSSFTSGYATITNSYNTKPSNNSFYTDTLFWSEEVWNIPSEGIPTLLWENAE